MNNTTQGLFQFIAKSPTGYHAVAAAEQELKASGHQRLLEGEDWRLEPGKSYYVTREQSSLIAFRMPETVAGFMVAAAHTDSPCFRIKEHGEIHLEGYTKLDVDKYGGMIFSAWLDRPLSLAGRLLVATDTGIETRLVHLDRDLLVIPSLAIHMDRSINEGKKFSAQTDLLPLLGKGEPDFLELAAEAAGVKKADILSHDLYLFCRTPGTQLGAQGELILCPRLDDLQCVYGLLEGYLHTKEPKGTPVLCLFDSEEVGSQTRQGAMSTFLKDTLRRICLSAGLEEQEYLRVLSHSMLVSADNAHGVHPNHPEKASLTSRPKLGEGVVIKFGSGYATSGTSAALLRQLLKGMPLQTYFNHGDIPGGRTLGQLALTQVPLNTVDIGLAQLAMHSACETAGTADTAYLIEAMERFFAARIRETAPGTFQVEH
jgi:aspartyl aminopeptidase